MIMSLKQKKIKFKPRIKLNHNIYIVSRMAHDSHCVSARFLIAFWLTSVLCNFSNTNNMNDVGEGEGGKSP